MTEKGGKRAACVAYFEVAEAAHELGTQHGAQVIFKLTAGSPAVPLVSGSGIHYHTICPPVAGGKGPQAHGATYAQVVFVFQQGGKAGFKTAVGLVGNGRGGYISKAGTKTHAYIGMHGLRMSAGADQYKQQHYHALAVVFFGFTGLLFGNAFAVEAGKAALHIHVVFVAAHGFEPYTGLVAKAEYGSNQEKDINGCHN